jgi:hypothetical protein
MAPATDRQQFREVLAGLAAKTLTKIPALNGRVEKATRLVLQGDVELHEDGTALVNSLTHPTLAYQVAPGLCQCKDYDRAPEHLCCHRLAVGFVRKIQAVLPTPPVPGVPDVEPWADNDPEPEPTPAPAPAPLGEAPCSVNVHLTIAGRQVQLTLRGHDEGDVLTRLETVLARYPQPQVPAQPQAQAPAPVEKRYCPKHGTEMQQNHKDGRSWWSHRLADGSWCKGK